MTACFPNGNKEARRCRYPRRINPPSLHLTQVVPDKANKLQIDRGGQARCPDLPDTQYESRPGGDPVAHYGQHSKRAPVWLTKSEARYRGHRPTSSLLLRVPSPPTTQQPQDGRKCSSENKSINFQPSSPPGKNSAWSATSRFPLNDAWRSFRRP